MCNIAFKYWVKKIYNYLNFKVIITYLCRHKFKQRLFIYLFKYLFIYLFTSLFIYLFIEKYLNDDLHGSEKQRL